MKVNQRRMRIIGFCEESIIQIDSIEGYILKYMPKSINVCAYPSGAIKKVKQIRIAEFDRQSIKYLEILRRKYTSTCEKIYWN